MKVLVIDDSRTVRRLLTAYLKELGIECIEAGDGLEALEQLDQHSLVDAALVDWDMPRMNGLEFVQAVRARPEYNSLKLMMVTAQTSFDSVVKALNAGATDYLMKPVTRQMLEEKLRLIGVVS